MGAWALLPPAPLRTTSMKRTASTELARRSERATMETSGEALGALHAEDSKIRIESRGRATTLAWLLLSTNGVVDNFRERIRKFGGFGTCIR